jgi:hypothetical protein
MALPRRFSFLASAMVVLACVCSPCGVAHARRVRPAFEPTDLELEDRGVLGAELQFGLARAEEGQGRFILPDFEVDLGVLPFLELDLDGTYAFEGSASHSLSLDHPAPDSLWLAAKFGIYDWRDPAHGTAFAIGAQLGPKLPVPSVHGTGAEALLLLGTTYRHLAAVWNVGSFADPMPRGESTRPRGIELGVDVNIGLDAQETWTINCGVSHVRFWSHDANQLLTAAGVTWSVSPMLDLSALGVVGLMHGGDRAGLLLGVAPKLRLFE